MHKFLILTGALFLSIGLIWAALWLFLANLFENRLEAWIEQRRGEGWLLAHDGIRVEGFPHRVQATIAAPTVASASLPGGHWHWRGEAVIAQIDLARHDILLLRLLGVQTVGLQEVGYQASFTGSALDLSVQAVQEAKGGYQLSFEGRKISFLQSTWLSSVDKAQGRVRLSSGRPLDPAFDSGLLQPAFVEISGSLQGVRFARDRHSVGRADFDLALMGRIADGPLKTALSDWRNEGGTFELRQLTVQDQVVDLRLRGTVALDDALRPLAALSGEIAGYDDILARLCAYGAIADRDAALARHLFAAMAEINPITGRTTINVPISIQNGIAMAGPLRLAKIAPLSFGKPQE